MSDTESPEKKPVTEIVGRFAKRKTFAKAVEALQEAGFEHADLSALDSHQSIDTALEDEETPWHERLSSLVGETKYVGPLTAAGFIAVATGPLGAAIATAVGAGVAGMAAKEFLEQVEATPRTEEFARALEQGAVLLWVYADSEERQNTARKILTAHGAEDVHLHTRS